MIAFSIGIVIGVFLRSVSPLFGYPFSGARWFILWSHVWDRVPMPRGVFVAWIAASIALWIVVAAVVVPIMFMPEYALAATKWWGFSYSRVAFVGVGVVLGFAVTATMIDARRSDAANIALRGSLLGASLLVAAVLIIDYERDGALLTITKISAGTVSIDFSNEKSGRYGFVSTESQDGSGEGAASDRIATALYYLGTLDDLEDRDNRIHQLLTEPFPQSPGPASATFASTIATATRLISEVHKFRRDIGPALYTSDDVLPPDLIKVLRKTVTAELWGANPDPKGIEEFNERLRELLQAAWASHRTFCKYGPKDTCQVEDGDRALVANKLEQLEISAKPYPVLTLSMMLHASGETEAGAAIVDRWLQLKRVSLEKVPQGAAQSSELMQRAQTQGKLQMVRALNFLAVMLADNSAQNKRHQQMAVHYYRAAYEDMAALIDRYPLAAAVDKAASNYRSLSATEKKEYCLDPANSERRKVVVAKRWLQNNFLYYLSQSPSQIEFEDLQGVLADYRAQLEKASIECLSSGSTALDIAITRATWLDTISRTYLVSAEMATDREDARANLCKAHTAAQASKRLLTGVSRKAYQRVDVRDGLVEMSNRLSSNSTWLLISSNARSIAKRVAESGYAACVGSD